MSAGDPERPDWDGSDPLPADPVPVLAGWLDDAFRAGLQPNPHAMALATVDADGSPEVRMVLCKDIDAARGRVTFYTHRESAKGRALDARRRAAACFYFGPQDRQARMVGPVERASALDSDAYFATRPREAQIGAWASRQSEPIADREALRGRVREIEERFAGSEVPRPPDWGGYVLVAESVELWISGRGRLHDRGLWRRALPDRGLPGAWRAERLQP